MMLPMHGGAYGKRRSGGRSVTLPIVSGVLALLVLILGWSAWSSGRKVSTLLMQQHDVKVALDSSRLEFSSLKARLRNRDNEYEHLSRNLQSTQQRLTETMVNLQKREADLHHKDQTIIQHSYEKDQLSSREAQLQAQIDQLKSEAEARASELQYSMTYIESLRKTIGEMGRAHAAREGDWHQLATKWHETESRMQAETERLVHELSKPSAESIQAANTYKPVVDQLPPEEPQIRDETRFNTDIPKYDAQYAHNAQHLQAAAAASAAGGHDPRLPNPHSTAGAATAGAGTSGQAYQQQQAAAAAAAAAATAAAAAAALPNPHRTHQAAAGAAAPSNIYAHRQAAEVHASDLHLQQQAASGGLPQPGHGANAQHLGQGQWQDHSDQAAASTSAPPVHHYDHHHYDHHYDPLDHDWIHDGTGDGDDHHGWDHDWHDHGGDHHYDGDHHAYHDGDHQGAPSWDHGQDVHGHHAPAHGIAGAGNAATHAGSVPAAAHGGAGYHEVHNEWNQQPQQQHYQQQAAAAQATQAQAAHAAAVLQQQQQQQQHAQEQQYLREQHQQHYQPPPAAPVHEEAHRRAGGDLAWKMGF